MRAEMKRRRMRVRRGSWSITIVKLLVTDFFTRSYDNVKLIQAKKYVVSHGIIQRK